HREVLLLCLMAPLSPISTRFPYTTLFRSDRLGSPEGDLALAQLVIYLASTAKSNAGYVAFGAAKRDVREHGTAEVPMHLRNAPTKLMKQLGYSKGYQYDHDADGGVALGQTGFPDAMGERVYYAPVERGLELKLKEKLDALRTARREARGLHEP